MQNNEIGRIIKITGNKVLLCVTQYIAINHLSVEDFTANYVSIGSFVGTHLVDGRTLVMVVEEIYDSENRIYITANLIIGARPGC